MNKLTLIVSVYNEEAALPAFYEEYRRLAPSFGCASEVLFVNDGSADKSADIIRGWAENDPDIKLLSFSRNFGHEAAMIAGIDHGTGDFLVCLDADLQHPLTCIPDIVAAADEGYEIVSMVRQNDSGFLRHIFTRAYYRMINKWSRSTLESGASDFFGLSSRAADVLRNNYRERNRFLRGYVQNIGFKKKNISYVSPERTAGKSKYPFARLLRLSMESMVCFSEAPLRIGIYAGAGAALLGVIMAIYTIITWVREGAPDGYATIICLICFMFAVVFFILGIFGEYMAVLFTEMKGRPLYIVEEAVNMKTEDDGAL